MQPEELFKAAEARSLQLEVPPPLEAALDRLRGDCVRFFGRIPEPPVYRRAEDPVRKTAADLLPKAQELYARCLALGRQEATQQSVMPLGEAVRWHLEALCHTAEGRLEAAEDAWREACTLERKAASASRLWIRSDEKPVPVFDRATGESRFDPRPEPHVRVKLACIQPSCQKIDEYAFSPRHPSHRFQCPVCKSPFIAYFGELQSVQVEDRGGHLKHYLFRVEEVGGGVSRIEFDETSGAELALAKRDMLAFLYTPDNDLRGVLNLSTSRLLWIRRGGCFVATMAFGEDAPELAAFRSYRDRVLLRSRAGVWLVRGYYRTGPVLARELSARPWTKALVRALLIRVHRRLVGSGYR